MADTGFEKVKCLRHPTEKVGTGPETLAFSKFPAQFSKLGDQDEKLKLSMVEYG